MTYVEIKKVHLKKGKRKYTARAIPSYAAHPCVQRTSVDVVPSGTSRSTYKSTQSSHPRDRSIDHIKKQVKNTRDFISGAAVPDQNDKHVNDRAEREPKGKCYRKCSLFRPPIGLTAGYQYVE